MRTVIALGLLCVLVQAKGVKKVTTTETSAANEQVDLQANIILAEADVQHALGADPGQGIVLLKVRVTPKTDKPLYVSPDDFILIANDDGERHKPFSPGEIAGSGAMVVTTKTAKTRKSSALGGFGGMMGGGSGSSPGNTPAVDVQTKMDDKKAGNNKLLDVLKDKELPTKESADPTEGYLYFALDGKHKLKNLEVLYRGAAGKLNLSFVQ